VQLQIASDIPLASGASGGEEIPAGPPPPKAYSAFLDKHYPHLKKKLLLVLTQLINSNDKDVISSALHTIMDRAPLVSYLVVKEILFRMKNLCFDDARNDPMNQQVDRGYWWK